MLGFLSALPSVTPARTDEGLSLRHHHKRRNLLLCCLGQESGVEWSGGGVAVIFPQRPHFNKNNHLTGHNAKSTAHI